MLRFFIETLDIVIVLNYLVLLSKLLVVVVEQIESDFMAIEDKPFAG